MTSASGPPPPGKPPRSAMQMRDMLGALALLAVLVLVVAGAARACSFSPGGPSVDTDSGPRVDAAASLRGLAPLVPFALRIPDVPPGWRANAVDQELVDGGRVVRAGYLTETGRFLRVVQSDAGEDALLVAEGSRSGGVPPAVGTVEVGERTWTVLGGAGAEAVWVTDTGPVRWLITGSAGEQDFRTLAAATAAGDRLPVGTTAPR